MAENPSTMKADNKKKLNVGNLPNDVTEEELREHFADHPVESVEIFHFKQYTLALLLFKDKETATKALKEKENSVFRGRRLRMHLEYIVICHMKKDVFVYVVDNENVTEEDVYEKFKDLAKVQSVVLFHPLAYVTCTSPEDKEEATKKIAEAGINVYECNGHDQNQHIDVLRAAKLFFRNLNRVQMYNIPESWVNSQDELKKAVEGSGTVTEVRVTTGNFGPAAQVFYETADEAKAAADKLNQQLFEGRRIHAHHVIATMIPNYRTSVYIEQLDKSITEEQLYDHFLQYGEIEFVNRRKFGDEHGLVCFKEESSVEKALLCTALPLPKKEVGSEEAATAAAATTPAATATTDGTTAAPATAASATTTTTTSAAAAAATPTETEKTIVVKRFDGPLVLDIKLPQLKKGTTSEEPEEQKQRPPPAPLAKLWPIYVANLPYKADKREIKKYFSSFGGHIKFIFSPNIPSYKQSQTSMVMAALIYFARREQANEAIKAFNGKHFQSKCLHVFPGRKDTYFDTEKSIKVIRLNIAVTEEKLFEKFRKFGFIECVVKKDRTTAYIEFRDKEIAEKVLKLDEKQRPVRCLVEPVTGKINKKIFKENDEKISSAMQEIIDKNPAVLENVSSDRSSGPPPLKRGRFSGPANFGMQGPRNQFNANSATDFSNPQVIQDLLRLAFISGKNLGEGLAISGNSNPFNSGDPPLANLNNGFGGGSGGGNRNNFNNSNSSNFGGSSNNSGGGGNMGNRGGNMGGGGGGLNRNFGGQNLGGGGGGGGGGIGGGYRNNLGGGGNFGGKRFNGSQQTNRMGQNNRQGGGGGGGGGGNNQNRRF
uniref:Putative glycine-rich cell wall structural protein 1 n=1 Tax=Anopheles braziliensis TaxID=58242 RepID=A0A2M3ZF76_9DIPT